jgi:hypothetical protein
MNHTIISTARNADGGPGLARQSALPTLKPADRFVGGAGEKN